MGSTGSGATAERSSSRRWPGSALAACHQRVWHVLRRTDGLHERFPGEEQCLPAWHSEGKAAAVRGLAARGAPAVTGDSCDSKLPLL